MPTPKVLELVTTRRRLEANDADLSTSTFVNVNLSGAHFEDVNLSATTITDANLVNLSITDANTTGMTIDGVLVSELQAAYRAARP